MLPLVPQINLRVDDETLARIEAARGDVARNAWLLRAVELALRSPLRLVAGIAPSVLMVNGEPVNPRSLQVSSADAKRGVLPIDARPEPKAKQARR